MTTGTICKSSFRTNSLSSFGSMEAYSARNFSSLVRVSGFCCPLPEIFSASEVSILLAIVSATWGGGLSRRSTAWQSFGSCRRGDDTLTTRQAILKESRERKESRHERGMQIAFLAVLVLVDLVDHRSEVTSVGRFLLVRLHKTLRLCDPHNETSSPEPPESGSLTAKRRREERSEENKRPALCSKHAFMDISS